MIEEVRVEIRQLAVTASDVCMEQGRHIVPAVRKVVAAAVITNPYARTFVDDLSPLVEFSVSLGQLLAERAVAALEGAEVHGYGKAAIVGLDGELEHAAALLHPALGQPFRDAVGGGKAIIPSSKKRGSAGCAIDIPLHHRNAAFVRSHFDAVEFRIPDAPFPGEILLALAVTSGGRPFPRVGGLQVDEIVGEDGLR